MLDLFLFPPGARGDFLASILFGDQLLADGKSATITNIGGKVTDIAKLHEFGQSEWADVFVTESDLSKYRTFIIDVSDPVDQQKVAWLNLCKKPPVEVGNTHTYFTLINIVTTVEDWHCRYYKYYQQFDHTIPFKNLFDPEYILGLYKKIHNTILSSDALERIKYNIDLNINIINQSPL